MDFEKELESRLDSVRQKEKEEAAQRKRFEEESELILKTKALIDPLLQTVAKKFQNAETEPTHDRDHKGDISFRFGTGTCCIIDFKKDKRYDFPESCRLAFEVKPINTETEELEITSALVTGKKELENYRPILYKLKNKSDSVYTGNYDSESIRKSVEKIIIETLDEIRVEQ